MSYHIFQKNERQSICVLYKKDQIKIKIKIKIKIPKIGKNVMSIVQFSICVALLHTKLAFTAFQDKGGMHLHPQKTCS